MHFSLLRAYKVYESAPYSNTITLCMESPLRDWPNQLDRIGPTQFHQANLWITRLLKYADRLSLLSLQSLEHRRLMVRPCNIASTSSMVTAQNLNSLTSSPSSHNPFSRGHSLRLSIPLVNNQLTAIVNVFIPSCLSNSWNSLPADIVNTTNVKLFGDNANYARLQPV